MAVNVIYPVTEAATEVETQTHESRCTSGVFPLVSKACRDLADIEARIKFLKEKISNGGPPIVLAAMKKLPNTSSVTLSLALSRGSSPNKPSLRRAHCRESSAHVRKTGCKWL